MTVIRFTGSQTPRDPVTQTVYTRGAWTESWTEQPYLYCEAATWSIAPNISTATLTYTLGDVLRPDKSKWETAARLDLEGTWDRFYVKVVLTRGNETLTWYGVIEAIGDSIEGSDYKNDGTLTPRGRQVFHAFGLESLLAGHRNTTSHWLNGTTFDEGRTGRGLTFNAGGIANASEVGSPRFEADQTLTRFFSSRQVARYLLEYQTPKDRSDLAIIPWELRESTRLPDWDRPILESHGRSTLELLNAVMPRQRLLSYFVGVDESTSPHTITVTPFTLNRHPITVDDSGNQIPGASRVKDVVFDADASAEASLQVSRIDEVHQVHVLGARRRSCFTAGVADETIVIGWSSTLQTEYNDGASGAGDYPASTQIMERQRRNEEARSAERLQAVYSRFALPDNWDYKAGNGLGTGTMRPVTPEDDDDTAVFELYRPDVFLLPTLPLLEDHDYSGNNISAESVSTTRDAPYEEMRPLVVAPLPEDTSRYTRLEDIGRASAQSETGTTLRSFSVSVHVPQRESAVWLVVHGAPQHAIAKTAWSPVDDSEWEIDVWDHPNFLYTLAIQDDRHCEARYPETLDANVEAVRRLVIQAGDGFRLDYVVPDTVVGVDGTDGSLKRSNGGFARDDRPALKLIARAAFEYYGTPRRALDFATGDFVGFGDATTGLGRGDLIETIGDPDVSGEHRMDVNSIVSEISIDLPRAEGGVPPPHTLRYRTAHGELDPLQVIV